GEVDGEGVLEVGPGDGHRDAARGGVAAGADRGEGRGGLVGELVGAHHAGGAARGRGDAGVHRAGAGRGDGDQGGVGQHGERGGVSAAELHARGPLEVAAAHQDAVAAGQPARGVGQGGDRRGGGGGVGELVGRGRGRGAGGRGHRHVDRPGRPGGGDGDDL